MSFSRRDFLRISKGIGYLLLLAGLPKACCPESCHQTKLYNSDTSLTRLLLEQKGIVKSSQKKTVFALTDWVRKHLRHGTDEDYRDMDVNELLETEGEARLSGCWEMSNFMDLVLGAVDIPVDKEGIEFENGCHSRFLLPSLSLEVYHSDDLYTYRLGSGRQVPNEAIYLSGIEIGDPQENTQNYSRFMAGLYVRYLPDGLLLYRVKELRGEALQSMESTEERYDFGEVYSPEEVNRILEKVDDLIYAISPNLDQAKDILEQRLANV